DASKIMHKIEARQPSCLPLTPTQVQEKTCLEDSPFRRRPPFKPRTPTHLCSPAPCRASGLSERPRKDHSGEKPTLPVRRKAEPRTVGPAKEELLWDGLTLNKCILIASFIALLSMGFQVFQGKTHLPAGAGARPCLLPPQAEPWFLKRWLGRSEPEEAEEPEATAEEAPEEPQAKAEPKKAKEKPREKPREKPERKEEKPRESRAAQVERGSKKEMQGKARPPEAKASRVPKEPQEDEEDEEEQPWPRKRVRGEGKEGRRGERHRKEEGKGHAPRLEAPGREEHKRNEERKRDSRQQREHKGKKPWEQGPVLPRRDSNHKLREGKRHD
uniref:Junctional sarcoplasmic reticulum protein 1 n=1 Tax=Crocodylus porosus TaxID=8502 RepID=A0A7M4FWZ7_CROPO